MIANISNRYLPDSLAVFGWERATYTTMSTVGTTALLGCLVDLDVLDDQVAGIEAFGVGV